MDLFQNIALGFSVALTAESLWYCFLGVFLGTIVGVLPGIGGLATIAMLMPLTFHLPATQAIIMLAGIHYGSSYGSSTASIMLNLPGAPSSAVTCLDGYPLSKQGRSGAAIMITTLASFVGSSLTIILISGFAPILAEIALNFGSPEYFSVMLFGLLSAGTLGQGSPVKGVVMVLFGLTLGIVGVDGNSGIVRYTYGVAGLYDGLHVIALAMGIFGVTEVLSSTTVLLPQHSKPEKLPLRSLIPTKEDLGITWKPMLRGTAVGAYFGVLPGTGASVAAFLSYALEKRIAKDPSRFGRGAMEGIAAPEAANNAASQAAFIPTLTLGIPGDSVMALILGALLIHGIIVGPTTMTDHPDLFWGLVASFWVGNAMLLVLNTPFVPLWVRILQIPYKVLYPCILSLICIGVYSVRSSVTDILVVVVAGVAGYGLRMLNFPMAPLLLGFILGPLMEENFRRSLVISLGDYSVFFSRPVSGIFMALSLLVLSWTSFSLCKSSMRK